MISTVATRAIGGSKTNFYSIDLLRGLAAVSILIFHYKNFGGGGGDLSRGPAAFEPIHLLHWLWVIRDYGALAVMLFWCISGFVFMNVYAGSRPPARQFWVNRIARLYPLHLATLLIIAAIQLFAMWRLGHWVIYHPNDLQHFLLQLVFASAWQSGAPHSFNGPIWSVSIEVLIYACFYFYARYARVNILTVVLGLGAFMVLMKLFPASQIPVCGAFFFGGMLAYAVFQAWPRDRHGLLLGLAAAGLLGMIALQFTVGRHLPLTLTLLPIFMCILLMAALSEASALRHLYRRSTVIGNLTYSTYLLHAPIQMMFLLGAGLGLWSVDIAFTDVFFVGFLLLTCVLASLCFRYFERPAQRWVRNSALGRVREKPLISAP